MEKVNLKIKLILRKDKIRKDGKCPLYYHVLLNGESFKSPTGVCVLEADWDIKKRIIKNNALETAKLDKNLSKFRETFVKEEIAGNKVTLEKVKAYFSDESTDNFYAFYDKYINRRRKEFSDQTYDKYVTTLKILKEFKSTLTFGEIDYKLICAFDYHLKTIRSNNGGETNRHKNLRTVLREAINCGIKVEYPYSKFKVKHKIPKTEFVPLEEINLINALDIPDSKNMLGEVRDMFVFSCYTGLRFSDVISLKWEHIKLDKTSIEKVQKKTKKTVIIGLCKKALEILNKRNCNTKKSDLVFIPISNQKANANLKKIAIMAGIKKRLTYHMARHSFGSNLAEKNVNLTIISNGMGHSNIKDTQRYAKVRPQVLIATVAVFD